MNDEYENSSKENLIAEIERLQNENATLRYNISIYQSVLASIRDTTKKYVPEVSGTITCSNSNINY